MLLPHSNYRLSIGGFVFFSVEELLVQTIDYIAVTVETVRDGRSSYAEASAIP